MPYFKRPSQLDCTLGSFEKLYGSRNDFEILLIEDYKNYADDVLHSELIEVLDEHQGLPLTHAVNPTYAGYVPGPHYNLAASFASGDRLILTNPEILHTVDILSELDRLDPCSYIVCSCLALLPDGSRQQWYQHSVHHNNSLHFCSCISRKQFTEVVFGFDAEYFDGLFYDDSDFIMKIRQAGIPVVYRDDLLTHHLWHDTSYTAHLSDLIERNHAIYMRKWG